MCLTRHVGMPGHSSARQQRRGAGGGHVVSLQSWGWGQDPFITEKVMDALDSVIQELDTSGTLEATTCKQIRHLIEAKAEMPPDALVAHKSRIKALVYERISGLLPICRTMRTSRRPRLPHRRGSRPSLCGARGRWRTRGRSLEMLLGPCYFQHR